MKKIVCMDLGNTIIHNDVICFEAGYEKLYSTLEITSMDIAQWKENMNQLYLQMYVTREEDEIEVPFQRFLKKAIGVKMVSFPFLNF